MRKYVLSPHLLGIVFGATGLITATRRGPRDTILILQWISWATGLVLAAAEIRARAHGRDDSGDRRAAARRSGRHR